MAWLANISALLLVYLEGLMWELESKSTTDLYSNYFLIPKWSSGFHPILDLRQLNKFLKVVPFRMLTLRG